MASFNELVRKFIKLNHPAVWYLKDLEPFEDGSIVYACDPAELRCPEGTDLIWDNDGDEGSKEYLFLVDEKDSYIQLFDYNEVLEDLKYYKELENSLKI